MAVPLALGGALPPRAPPLCGRVRPGAYRAQNTAVLRAAHRRPNPRLAALRPAAPAARYAWPRGAPRAPPRRRGAACRPRAFLRPLFAAFSRRAAPGGAAAEAAAFPPPTAPRASPARGGRRLAGAAADVAAFMAPAPTTHGPGLLSAGASPRCPRLSGSKCRTWSQVRTWPLPPSPGRALPALSLATGANRLRPPTSAARALQARCPLAPAGRRGGPCDRVGLPLRAALRLRPCPFGARPWPSASAASLRLPAGDSAPAVGAAALPRSLAPLRPAAAQILLRRIFAFPPPTLPHKRRPSAADLLTVSTAVRVPCGPSGALRTLPAPISPRHFYPLPSPIPCE